MAATGVAAQRNRCTMERELQVNIMHSEARANLITDLLDWAGKSMDNGEYYISVNGNHLWLSFQEVSLLLFQLRSDANQRLDVLRRQAAEDQTAKIPWEEHEMRWR